MGLAAAIQRGGDRLRKWWRRGIWRRIGHRGEVVSGGGSEAGRVEGRRGGAGAVEAGRGEVVGESGGKAGRGEIFGGGWDKAGRVGGGRLEGIGEGRHGREVRVQETDRAAESLDIGGRQEMRFVLGLPFRREQRGRQSVRDSGREIGRERSREKPVDRVGSLGQTERGVRQRLRPTQGLE